MCLWQVHLNRYTQGKQTLCNWKTIRQGALYTYVENNRGLIVRNPGWEIWLPLYEMCNHCSRQITWDGYSSRWWEPIWCNSHRLSYMQFDALNNKKFVKQPSAILPIFCIREIVLSHLHQSISSASLLNWLQSGTVITRYIFSQIVTINTS